MKKIIYTLFLLPVFSAFTLNAQTVIVQENFDNSTGSEINLRNSTPQTNLPGGTWQYAAGYSWTKWVKGASWSTYPNAGFVDTDNSGISISLTGNGDYTKPTLLRISADIRIGGSAATVRVGLGFYSQINSAGSAAAPNFTGLGLINGTAGSATLCLYENGVIATAQTITIGVDIAKTTFYTLTYDINTTTGAISNISIAGIDETFEFTTTAFTDAATAYAAFNVLSGGNSRGAVDNFTVYGLEDIQPEVTISSFTPATAAVGETITITGTNFTGATAVSIGGVPATSFIVVNETTITAVVGAGASDGDVSVTTPDGTATEPGFTLYVAVQPEISSFTPATAAVGETITITGTNFTGATAVSIGGVPATSFAVVNETTITAVVGAGASDGDVSVTTPDGTATEPGFTLYVAVQPEISSFAPATAAVGETITITGTNFTGATAVSIGGVDAAYFTVADETTIAAVVGDGASDGDVSVTTPDGTDTKPGFVLDTSTEVAISLFTPAVAAVGATITIYGTNFTDAAAVSIGGVPAASFTVVDAITITAVVGAGATSGDVSVTTAAGTDTKPGFVLDASTGLIDNGDANQTMTVYKNANNQIVINNPQITGTEGIVIISNLTGQQLLQTTTTGPNTTISKPFGSGVYLVTVNVSGKNNTRKIIIN